MDVESLYLDHAKGVKNACYLIVRNWSDAEDITHGVFLKVLTKPLDFYHEGAAKKWLHTAARFDSLTFLKRKQRIIYTDELPDITKTWSVRTSSVDQFCSFDGCVNIYKAKGLCNTHYKQTRPKTKRMKLTANYRKDTAMIIAGICRKLIEQFA